MRTIIRAAAARPDAFLAMESGFGQQSSLAPLYLMVGAHDGDPSDTRRFGPLTSADSRESENAAAPRDIQRNHHPKTRAVSMTDIILHHYEISPYSEKVRLGLGLKGLAWG